MFQGLQNAFLAGLGLLQYLDESTLLSLQGIYGS